MKGKQSLWSAPSRPAMTMMQVTKYKNRKGLKIFIISKGKKSFEKNDNCSSQAL